MPEHPQANKVPPLRAGSTLSTFTRLDQVDLTERGKTSYCKVYGSEAKLPRYNEAEVR